MIVNNTVLPDSKMPYSKLQFYSLLVLQLLIGWHFLSEGLVKLYQPGWSSAPYLLESKGVFSHWFISLAGKPVLLALVDFLNIWGLILIGIGLIAGLFTRYVTVAGILMLLLYYLSQPPFPGLEYSFPAEGSYLIVNKTLIEMAAMMVLFAFPIRKWTGLELIIFQLFRKK